MPTYEVTKAIKINGVDLKEGMRVTLSEEEAVEHDDSLKQASAMSSAGAAYNVGAIAITPGRIVYYKSGGDMAAIVTQVGEDGLIDLLVAYPGGWTPKHKIMQGPEDGNWDWMPFQKDQQARLGNVSVGQATQKSA